MSVIALALAGDPATPTATLTAIARTPGLTPYVRDLLVVHPDLPDDALPEPAAPGGGDLYSDVDVDSLIESLHVPHATPATRTRALLRAPRLTVHAYLADRGSGAVPEALPVLASSARTGVPAQDLPIEFYLAVTPGTAPARRLTALSACLPHQYTATSPWAVGLNETGYINQLTTIAARHFPSLLGALAALTAHDLVRQDLRQLAAVHAAGGDVHAAHLDTHRRTARARGTARAWTTAIAGTGDAAIAAEALAAVEGPDQIDVLDTISFLRLLDGTPAQRRAQVALASGGQIPATAADTSLGAQVAVIAAYEDADTAHDVATKARATDPDAHTLLLAGWARRDQRRPWPTYAARYALHPAMPHELRAQAIDDMHVPSPREAHLHDQWAAVTRLTDHAHTFAELHDTLLDTPLTTLQAVADEDWHLEQLLAHHLGIAARTWHEDLDEPATRALLTLTTTFTGTARELLDTVAAITS